MTRSALREHPNEGRRHATLREFWLHVPTGYVWAVEIDSSGRLIAAAGPLAKRDTEPLLLDYLVYKPGDVAWIVRHRPEFTRVEF